ncbi:MAG TPA: putative lipid II flippase FtsW [Candidatus Sumerlaeota bacterium]|nr:putative lipid II flippase FtsW [Candidatus Sumerlaeota bacterium]
MKRNTTLCIFIVTLALVSIGTVMVYSSSAATAAYHDRLMIYRKAPELLEKTNHYHDADYLKKQLIWVVLGVMAMLICYNVDYARLGKYSPYILGAAVLLLIAVLIFGVRINGAKRWLRVGMFTIQPSEFAKLALVIFMSRFLAEHKNKVKSFVKGFLPVLSILGATLVLVILEPDLGSTAVIGAIIFIIWFVAGLRILHLSSLFIASIPCGLVAIFKWRYQLDRIIAFTNPWKYRDGIGFQMVQAQIAVGTGGLHGHGLGAGMQKYQFLAEAHTDYIFAILAEETGFIGGVFLVILFVALLYLGMTVALRASDYYPGLLASGIVTMICLSSAVNFFVVLSMLPPKGLALPFISYGGSSLFVNMAAIGILLNISKSTEEAALAAMPR